MKREARRLGKRFMKRNVGRKVSKAQEIAGRFKKDPVLQNLLLVEKREQQRESLQSQVEESNDTVEIRENERT